MPTNKNAVGEVRFVCSGCGRGCFFAAEVRRIAAARVRASGWEIYEGEAVCPECASERIETALRRSVQPPANGAVPVTGRCVGPNTDAVETVRPGRAA